MKLKSNWGVVLPKSGVSTRFDFLLDEWSGTLGKCVFAVFRMFLLRIVVERIGANFCAWRFGVAVNEFSNANRQKQQKLGSVEEHSSVWL